MPMKEGMPMKSEGMQGEGMMMGKMKDIQGRMGEMRKGMGGMMKGQGDDEGRRYERHGKHDG